MTFNKQRLRHLLNSFADNKAAEHEIEEMLNLLRQQGDKELESFITELKHEPNNYTSEFPVDWENVWDKIHHSAIKPEIAVRKMRWFRAAAAILILITIGAYFFNHSTKSTKKEIVRSVPVPIRELPNDVQPGGNKAILTLANGSQIILDSASNGILAKQGKTNIVKLSNGQLAYQGVNHQSGEVMYNTIGTPRGGQYKLVLPDGSGVWLNAISSIRFPTAFLGKERKVQITGEAYFEITKDHSRPFKVIVMTPSRNEGMEVEVLGTHFNINAYNDEPEIKTTLLEGSVKVNSGNNHMVIKPGQQSQVNSSGILKLIPNADVDEAVAWKDGRFEFRDADLKTILRQIMRWYDVDVAYESNLPDRYFTAAISRNKSLTGVLKILRLSDIDFKLDGKKLTVIP
jgi:ferric-dicitrate binding protein FerR (iron transport regulator)